jgi:hypothetical protein
MEKSCPKKPTNIKEFIKSSYFWKPFLGLLIGGTGGFLYYYFIGCASGSCPITGNPYVSTIWGGLFGFALVSSPCANRKCS